MSNIYLLHADTTGTDSIQDVIDAKAIVYLPVKNIDVYDRICHKLLDAVTPNTVPGGGPDTVILDTTSQMGHNTRIDIRFGTDESELLWERYGRITSKKDNDGYAAYTNSAQLIMRRLKNLYNRGCRIVTTCHEEERIDAADGRKKHNIGLNDEFRKMLEASSSDIFRLSQLTENLIDPETAAVQLSKGTRLLHIRRTEDVNAKMQIPVPRDVELMRAGIESISLPVGDGGWSKMVRILGKTPSWLTLYGLPGVGKTNFVVRRGPEPAQLQEAQKEAAA